MAPVWFGGWCGSVRAEKGLPDLHVPLINVSLQFPKGYYPLSNVRQTFTWEEVLP